MSTTFRTSTGNEITFELEGIAEVQKELDELIGQVKDEASVEMMTKVGDAVKWWMQQNILKEKLLKTGALFNSVFVTALTNDNGSDVYIGPNTEEVVYAMIQNYGGDIYPKNAKYLHFWYNGKEIFSKHVYLPPRPYIEPAFDDHQEEILTLMEDELYAAIAAGTASI